MTVPYRADQVGSFLRPAELLEARHARATRRSACARSRTGTCCACSPASATSGSRSSPTASSAGANFMSDFYGRGGRLRHGDAVARIWQVGATAAAHGEQRHRHRDAEAPAAPTAHRARAPVPEAAQPRRDQDDAAQRHPVPGDRLQARRHGRGLPRPFRAALGHRGDHEGRAAALAEEGVVLPPDRRAALQLLHRPEVARLDPHRDGPGPRGRCWTRSIRADNACLERGARPRRDARHPPLPRQQPQPLVRRGRLRRRSPRSSSPPRAWTASCSSTTTSAPGRSSPCASCPAARRWSSGLVAQQAAGAGGMPPSWRAAHRGGGALRAARHLALSPQCGFASTMEGNLLTEEPISGRSSD